MRAALAVLRIAPFVLALGVVKHGEQPDDDQVGAGRLSQRDRVLFHLPPVVWPVQRPLPQPKVGGQHPPEFREVDLHC